MQVKLTMFRDKAKENGYDCLNKLSQVIKRGSNFSLSTYIHESCCISRGKQDEGTAARA